MHWQDIVLAVGAILFTLALIPSIRSKNKPAVFTSILTALVLASVTITYASLSLWFSTAAAIMNALAWLTLAVQKFRQKD